MVRTQQSINVLLNGWCLVSQGISIEPLKILTISAWFWKSNGFFMERLMLVFDSPKLCLLLWILPALHLWLKRIDNGLLILFRFVLFLLEYCLYPVSFLALLILKQTQHYLSYSVSKFIHILKTGAEFLFSLNFPFAFL